MLSFPACRTSVFFRLKNQFRDERVHREVLLTLPFGILWNRISDRTFPRNGLRYSEAVQMLLAQVRRGEDIYFLHRHTA